MNKMHDLKAKRTLCGFTIVELLTVMAIIAVLTALTLGVMAPARERGRRTTCSSNLHQIHSALMMYSADWEGREPEIGSKMTYSEMGLPPAIAIIPIYKTYGLWKTAALWCPSYRRRKGEEGLLTPYVIWSEDQAEKCSSIQGVSMPVVSCTLHNEKLDIESQPNWSPFAMNVVRHSGQVSFSIRSVKDAGNCAW